MVGLDTTAAVVISIWVIIAFLLLPAAGNLRYWTAAFVVLLVVVGAGDVLPTRALLASLLGVHILFAVPAGLTAAGRRRLWTVAVSVVALTWLAVTGGREYWLPILLAAVGAGVIGTPLLWVWFRTHPRTHVEVRLWPRRPIRSALPRQRRSATPPAAAAPATSDSPPTSSSSSPPAASPSSPSASPSSPSSPSSSPSSPSASPSTPPSSPSETTSGSPLDARGSISRAAGSSRGAPDSSAAATPEAAAPDEEPSGPPRDRQPRNSRAFPPPNPAVRPSPTSAQEPAPPPRQGHRQPREIQ